jgi:DNA-binding transcriptional ArsR family regulator
MEAKGMFKALASDTRRRMLRLLLRREYHISGLAKELGISTPVAAKHVKILEEAKLVERQRFGKTHVLKAKLDTIYSAFDELAEKHEVAIKKGATVLEALRQVSGIEIEERNGREYVTNIDGEEGYYIYEVDGNFPEVGMEKFVVERNITVELKKLVPVKRKVLKIVVVD